MDENVDGVTNILDRRRIQNRLSQRKRRKLLFILALIKQKKMYLALLVYQP